MGQGCPSRGNDMADTGKTVDQLLQEWDDQKIKLRETGQKPQGLGPWASLVNQRVKNFVERWRPDRMRLIQNVQQAGGDAAPDKVRSRLAILARQELGADLRSWG